MNRLHQLYHLAQVFAQPGGLQAYLRWKPFSITAYRMLRALKAQGFRFGTVLDAGANAGQFSRAAAETYPAARIFAYEALPDVAATLRRNLADRPRVQVVETALGARDGTLAFFRNAYSLASSALPLHANQRTGFPEAAEVTEIRVPVARLDALLADEPLPAPVLLKLDLQGYELEALRGAPETLARADYVLLETAFKTMYEGEPLFEEVHAFMREAGFRFVRPVDFLEDAAGEIVQMDALFARAGR